MIQFILGRSGSGKTTLMRKMINHDTEKGRDVILLIPEQEVLSNETALCSMDSDTALHTQVLSFRRLANTVFRKYGGLKYNYITKGERTVIMWRALCSVAPSLRKYAGVSIKDRGFLSSLLAQIDEMKAYCVTPHMLDAAADSLTDAQKDLKNKLYDISVIYSAYNTAMSLKYSDPADDLVLLSEMLEEYSFFENMNIYIDSFNGFTEIQYRILDIIFATAKNVTVSLSYDGNDANIMYSYINETAQRLRKSAQKAHCEIGEDIVLTEQLRYNNDEIKYLEKNIWDFSAKEYESRPEHITLATLHDAYSEAEYIARDINKKIRRGKRYRDITVITRNTDDYTGIIDAVFEKHQIPLFISARTDITLLPSVKLILSALAIKISNFRTDDVISYIKTGLCSLSCDECDILENYAATWNISGRRWYDDHDWTMNPRGYVEEFKDSDIEALDTVNALRKKVAAPLVAFFEAFSPQSTVKSITESLYKFMREIGLYENTHELYGNEYDSAQAWNIMIESIGELVNCSADEIVDAQTFRDLLCAILSEKDIGSIPDTVDKVTFGDASLIRVSGAKDVYLCGVSEGHFPAVPSEGTFFSDPEKKTLEALGISLSPDMQTDNSQELYYFYRALCCASDNITITYPAATLSGIAYAPSIGFKRVKKLFPLCDILTEDDIKPIDYISDNRSAFDAAALFAGSDLGQALIDEYSLNDEYKYKIRSLDTPISDTVCSLDEATAKEIYKGDLSLTQSRLDTFAKCRFSYSCKYLLSLQSEGSSNFKSTDIGNFIHMLLERFFSHTCKDGDMNPDLSKDEIEKLVDELIEDYIRRVFRDKRNISSRLIVLLTRLRRTSLLLISNILAEFRQSPFRPAFFELPISSHDENAVAPYSIPLGDGTNAVIYGKIDRVDTYKKGNDVYIRIVDYKTGKKTLSLEHLKRGQEMQMLLYMYSIWKTKDTDFIKKIGAENGSIIPAGVEYYIAKVPSASFPKEVDTDEVMKAADESIERTGIRICEDPENDKISKYDVKDACTLEEFGKLSEDIAHVTAEIASEIKAGKSDACWLGDAKDECLYCDMHPICRKDR